jgi:hypothetical protein
VVVREIAVASSGRRHEHPDILAQHLIRGVSENRLGSSIEQRHLAAAVDAMMKSRAYREWLAIDLVRCST